MNERKLRKAVNAYVKWFCEAAEEKINECIADPEAIVGPNWSEMDSWKRRSAVFHAVKCDFMAAVLHRISEEARSDKELTIWVLFSDDFEIESI